MQTKRPVNQLRASPTTEDYLLVIYTLQDRNLPVTGARLAERLKVSRPTVLGMLQRMVRDNLATLSQDKKVSLTPKGWEMAESVVRRHRLAERLFTDLLGLKWYDAHEEAHQLEHAISDAVAERISAVLNHPQTCPHGNPIPGNYPKDKPRNLIPLTHAPKSAKCVVESVSEELEDDPRAMAYLDNRNLRPGAQVTVVEVSQANGTVDLETPSGPVSIGLKLAAEVGIRLT